jgi:hypothetical protein
MANTYGLPNHIQYLFENTIYHYPATRRKEMIVHFCPSMITANTNKHIKRVIKTRSHFIAPKSNNTTLHSEMGMKILS